MIGDEGVKRDFMTWFVLLTKCHWGYQIKEFGIGWECSRYGCLEIMIMMAEPERKTPLGRPRRKWDIDEGLMEIVWEGSGQLELGSEQREAATSVCGNKPSVSTKYREFLD